MIEEWKSPKTIIGSVATGLYYYPRTEIVNEIWGELIVACFYSSKRLRKWFEKYMVLYYVTQILNHKLENNLMLRIPPELQGTIKEVIQKLNSGKLFMGIIKSRLEL